MKNNSLTIAGFMSGTSMDGLACCIAKVDISKNWDFNYEIIATKSFDFSFNVGYWFNNWRTNRSKNWSVN